MNAIVQEKNGVAEYDEFRAKINEIKEACNFLPDVTTDEGYQKSKRVALDVGKVLTALEKRRKELKAESLEFGRKVDAEAKAIAQELAEFQGPHKAAYKELDDLRKQREADRKAALQERVDNMRNLPEAMADSSSDEVKAALQSLMDEECLDFYEFTEQALKARNSAKEALSKLFADKLRYEHEQAELKRLREAEEARLKKENEERIAREATEAAERAAQEKIDQERAAKEAAEQAAKEAKAHAERAAIEAAERAEREKQEAVARAEREAKEREEKAEAERQAAIAKEQAEKEKREANKKHRAKINNTAVAAILNGTDLDEGQAEEVIDLIAQGKVPAVQINY